MAVLCTKDFIPHATTKLLTLLLTVKDVLPENVTMYKHSRIMPEWFNSSIDVFCNIPNTPDVVFLDRDRRELLILEMCVRSLHGHGF